jgi:hypothetical protein
MKLYLNIGLGGSKSHVDDNTQLFRRGLALDWLAQTFGTFSVECGHTAFERVIAVEVPVIQPRRSLDSAILNLCHAIQQDCIAVVFKHVAQPIDGRLIGPRADEWLPFNQDQFVFPTWRFK